MEQTNKKNRVLVPYAKSVDKKKFPVSGQLKHKDMGYQKYTELFPETVLAMSGHAVFINTFYI